MPRKSEIGPGGKVLEISEPCTGAAFEIRAVAAEAGALRRAGGDVVGVVCAQLSQAAALANTGVLAQSVNYAVKSSYLLSFLEAVPEVGAGMVDAKTRDQKFEAVVDDVKKAAVLIIGY